MLMVEVYITHPVLRTFADLLGQTRIKRFEVDTAGLVYVFITYSRVGDLIIFNVFSRLIFSDVL